MSPRRPETISLASLSRAVDSAIKIAAKRHSVVVDSQTILNRWELIGRRLRDVKDLNVGYQIAKDVSAGVKIPGLRLQPVVSRIGNDILIGFIERGSLPKVLPR
jgi:hypothetical protein